MDSGGLGSVGRSSRVVLTLVDVARPLLLRALLVVLVLIVPLGGGPLKVKGFRVAALGINGVDVRWHVRRMRVVPVYTRALDASRKLREDKRIIYLVLDT